jgi:hypothetical protein
MFGSMWDAVSDRDYLGYPEDIDEAPEESPIEQPADVPEGDAAAAIEKPEAVEAISEECPF